MLRRSPAPSSPLSGCALLKIGARVIEKAARIRIHFSSACPDAALFRLLAGRSQQQAPDRRGAVPRKPELPLNPQRPVTTKLETGCLWRQGKTHAVPS